MRRLVPVLLLALALAGCATPVRLELPSLDVQPQPSPVQSVVRDAHGEQIAVLRTHHREPVAYADLPEVLVDAVLAAEDQRFFDHGGVDARAIARAAIANQRAGEVVQGGSTITQQLAKNRYLPEAEATLERKVTEARLARELEQRMGKESILTDYLNTIYLGEGAYGIAAAASVYFDAEPADLDLAEAALLAGIIREPVAASPHRDPERALAARARVLEQMVATGAISPEEADEAARAPLALADPPEPPATEHPFFVDAVVRELLADPRLGEDETARVQKLYGGGLEIETTIDPRAQAAAEEAAATGRERLAGAPGGDPEVAAAVVRPADGHVLAVVGGADHGDREFDLATQGRRQPGSAFKTFALVAALEDGWRLDDTIDSGSVSLRVDAHGDAWTVRSATSGPMRLDQALARSSNGAFARLAVEVGGERVAEAAHRLGISSELGTHPAIALGGLREGVSPLEMASAYAAIAAGGVSHDPVLVTRVTDAEGHLLADASLDASPRVAVDGETAWFATRALQAVIEDGTGTLADPGRPAIGKTGTSQRYRDAWFAGSTPELAAAVWIGHPDTAQRLLDPAGAPVMGGSWPARVWRDLVVAALDGVPEHDFPYPEHLEITLRVDPVRDCVLAPDDPAGETVTGLPGELPDHRCPEPEPEPEPEDDPTEETATPDADDSPGGSDNEPGDSDNDPGDSENDPGDSENDGDDADERD